MSGAAALSQLVHRLGAASTQLDPSREQAREWARRELSEPAYAKARPGWVERLARWLIERLMELRVPDALAPSRSLGLVLLLALLALALIVILTRTGRLRRGARTGAVGAVLDDVRRTSTEHRRLADEAAAAGRFDVAVRERFRAVARSLQERALLDERPGRTALELATEAGRILPGAAAGLRAAARVFDDVCYGGRVPTSTHDAQLRQLDRDVAAARPVLELVTAGAEVSGR